MAFVGTRAMLEVVGFEVVGKTDAAASKMARLVMDASQFDSSFLGVSRFGIGT